jgi:hypothetical protein
MFGFNIPTFKLLDVCSIEFQWFGSKYWNTWENVWKNATPTPYVGFSRYESYEDWSDVTINPDDDSSEVARKQSYKEYAHMDRDDWKWSLYMAKWLNKRIKLSLIFANDNSPKSLYGPGAPFASKFTEMTHRTWWNGKWGMIWDWYWMARVMFYF